jgi:signal transduction histidine kinase
MYLALGSLKMTMTSLARLSNCATVLILTSYTLFAFFLINNKWWFKLLLLVPVAFFAFTNDPYFCYDAYFRIYSSSQADVQFLETFYGMVNNVNMSIFLIYMCIPILSLIIYYKRTKLFFLKHDALVSICCIILINTFVLSVFMFGVFRVIMFHNMDLLKFPESLSFADYTFFTPILLVFFVFTVAFFIIYYKPFGTLTVITEKQLLRNTMQLNKNLRMILHSEKNRFFAIDCIAKQGLENENNSIEKLKTISSVANESINNLNRILNLFRDPKITLKKSDIVKCIDNALNNVFALNNGITIKTCYDNNALYIDMDENHIYEVFSNLFRNSQEALKIRSNDDAYISVSVTSAEGFAIVNITDNGCGIEKKNLRKIFSPMFSTKSNSTNWGVGLNYVDNVLRLHNGRIRVSSELGLFTTFQVVIPIARNHRRRGLFEKNQNSIM